MPGTIGVDRAKQPGSLNRLRQAQKLEIVPSCSTGKAEQICPVQEKPQAGQNQSSWPGVVPARRYPYRVLFPQARSLMEWVFGTLQKRLPPGAAARTEAAGQSLPHGEFRARLQCRVAVPGPAQPS
jgi:hypothetical protein